MKKLAIHLHVYYHEQIEEIINYLKNISDVKYDLFVTLNILKKDTIKKLKTFNPDVKIIKVENRGYDVGPFIHFLHQINLRDYDYILKLHTKNKQKNNNTLINNRFIDRKTWFMLLYGDLLGSKEIFNHNISEMNKNSKLGMIGSKYLIIKQSTKSQYIYQNTIKTMDSLGYKGFSDINFIAGTMFLMRSTLLHKIKSTYKITDFNFTDSSTNDNTLAHIFERIFGCIVIAEGYTIQGFVKRYGFELKTTITAIKRFLFQKKITQSGNLLIKVCKIPVYNRRIA